MGNPNSGQHSLGITPSEPPPRPPNPWGLFPHELLIAEHPRAPKFVRITPPRWRLRPTAHQPVSVGPTPPLSGFDFDHDGVALEGVATSSTRWHRRSHSVLGVSSSCKTSTEAPALSSRTCWGLPRTNGKNSGHCGDRPGLERYLNQVLLELQALVLTVQTLSSMTSWRATSWRSR